MLLQLSIVWVLAFLMMMHVLSVSKPVWPDRLSVIKASHLQIVRLVGP